MFAFGGFAVYKAWRFKFDYADELAHPVHGRGAGWYWLSLQDHGQVGVVMNLAIALLCALFAASMSWRFFTRLPAVILMPDQLWIHPSFGRKPIAYSNIVGVSLDRLGRNQIALTVATEKPIDRNGVFWIFSRTPYQFLIRETVVDASLYDLTRFRNRLASNAEAARKKLHKFAAI